MITSIEKAKAPERKHPMHEAPTVCPTCGTAPRAAARFCDGCGSALESVHSPAEYKQVTVLFADVTRSMDLAAAVGPERLREIMNDVVDRSTAVVRRYGGTIDKFIGDGIMALFGAPVALEDHALRACLAAIGIQEEAERLAADIRDQDGVSFAVRVGLNSGEVIAGDIGSTAMSYTVIGEQVGMAQRMESAAPPGGVMISESTARLVEHATKLGQPERVTIKGAVEPVPARRLLAVEAEPHGGERHELTLVGRQRELHLLQDMLFRALKGQGCIARVKGPPGIGKSRLTRETASAASAHGFDVVTTHCESHFTGIPFHAVAGLLRGFFGVGGLSSEAARACTRGALPTADPADLTLLDDLLGIRDDPSGPDIDPDARRRRLAILLDTALLSRREPTVYVIEDAHWIDATSESMLLDFVSVIPRTPALLLITYRPEYAGVLGGLVDSTEVSLVPLDNTQAQALTAELLGSDPSVAALSQRIAERAAGNPFFTEEIVRDLAERDVLEGARGSYVRRGEAEVSVPATVQTTIAARIDRLEPAAKRTLNAAAVIGSRFSADILSEVLDSVDLVGLLAADMIDQLAGTPTDYAFRHPLIHAVAYESQLKAGRAPLHRTIATAIERRDPDSIEKNAALIANHLESAGDLAAAFGWHMRAGTWSTHRDISAARASWQRAVAVADRLPDDDPGRLAMRVAPRTLLCATIWRVGGELADAGFDELRSLTDAAGDKRSLAIGMCGVVQTLNLYGEFTEASRVASEHIELLDAIGDPEMTVALLAVPIIAKWDAGEMGEALRLAERAIALSGGDPTMGNLIFGSPLAFMLALRASTRCCLGIAGWHEDFDSAVETARDIDPFTHSTVTMVKYVSTLNWALLPDDAALDEMAELLRITEHSGDDFQLANARFTLGLALVRSDGLDRQRGFELLRKVRESALQHQYVRIAAVSVDLDLATEMNRTGDVDGAIALCRDVLAYQLRAGEGINRGWATTILVEALLHRGRDGDLAAAQDAVDQLAAMPTEPVFLYHELPLLRLTALLARARGDESVFRDFRDQYRARAQSCGYAGHIALADAMAQPTRR